VKDILFIQGNDLLVVEREGREVFVPFTEPICIEIDLKGKKIVIDPPDGLLDLNEI
jgi:16S rRNA processing protein RimM